MYDILANGHPDHPEYPDITADPATIQPIYGCGVDQTRLDYETFRSWVEFSRRPPENDPSNFGAPYGLGRKLNIVFDTFTTAWDAILRICQEGRGIVFPIGAKFYAMVDKPVTDVVLGGNTDAEVTQLFSMGNINKESFRQQWSDKSKKATAIEVVFFDEDNDYLRTTFIVRTSTWADSGELNNPIQLVLHGTTEYRQAFAQALYLLNNNTLLSQIVVFESNIESLQAQVGDVIRVQHDSMTGEGGKVVGYSDPTTNFITLDKTVTIVSGTTYEFLLQLSDGSLRMKTVTGGSSTNILDFGEGTTWPTNPAQYDSWAFGEAGAGSKLFRIIDIGITGDYSRLLTCLEYDARAYQADWTSTDSEEEAANKVAAGDYSPTSDVSNTNVEKVAPNLALPAVTIFNTATNLMLEEVISRNRATGEYESNVVVSWDADQGDNWGEWDILWRDVDGDDQGWIGNWDVETSYDLYDRVLYNGEAYISLAANNQGYPPHTL